MGILNCGTLSTHPVYDSTYGHSSKSTCINQIYIQKGGGGVAYHPFENQVALLISRLWLNYKYYIKIGILVELHMNIKVRTLTCRHKNRVTTRIYQTSS